MKKERRRFSAHFKTKVAIEVIKEKETILQLASKFEVHSNQITLWKREFLAGADQVFSNKKAEEKAINEQVKEFIYSKTVRLQTIFPKKNLSKRNQKHKIYPYLLKNLQIVQSNQVWQTDII